MGAIDGIAEGIVFLAPDDAALVVGGGHNDVEGVAALIDPAYFTDLLCL